MNQLESFEAPKSIL